MFYLYCKSVPLFLHLYNEDNNNDNLMQVL